MADDDRSSRQTGLAALTDGQGRSLTVWATCACGQHFLTWRAWFFRDLAMKKDRARCSRCRSGG